MSSPYTIASIRNADRIFVSGQWINACGTGSIEVRDSASEDVFLIVPAAGHDDVERAVSAAREAFDDGPWPMMTPAERAGYLMRIADGIDRRSADFADSWTSESGVLRAHAEYVAMMCSGVFRYYAGLAESFAWQEKHTAMDGLPALLVREPVGVVAAIVPWNAPATLMTYKVAPALLAGCTVIVKASPEAPSSAYLLAEICEEIGLPPGVLNVLAADRDVSESLVRNPGIDKVSFTGSTVAGRKIASICGERIARCTLELGGKSPAIILDDYDVGKAAEAIATAAPFMTGQVCSSLTRIIISESRHDDFVDALSASFGAVRVGDPRDPQSGMGPLASDLQRGRVENYIAAGKADGARLVCGGGRPAHLNRGYYIEPTVFASVDNNWTIAQEEIFGPVLSVIPAKDEQDAIRIANDTIYGLNSSIFTNDAEKAYAIGRRLRAGTVGHNAFKSDFSISFGGFKQSGLGREGGVEGLHPYLEAKTMILETMPRAGL